MSERQTKPVFARADGTLVAAALQEPSLTLFESHRDMGFFVARGCQEDSFAGRLRLEEVIGQMLAGGGRWNTVNHDQVIVGKEDTAWTARSPTGELIVSTGAAPFVVLFIAPDDYQQLADLVKRAMTEAVITHVVRHLRVIPPTTRILLPRWSGKAAGPAVRIRLPQKSKETVRITLPPKPKPHDPGSTGRGGS